MALLDLTAHLHEFGRCLFAGLEEDEDEPGGPAVSPGAYSGRNPAHDTVEEDQGDLADVPPNPPDR
ncbi:hypothetical protein [Planotetraspora kaengkrachanensis]|uniref:hypothetical protein n=1 Tax=Planotetraspora kaengkrachanensis TaxID=575193 RepID=UPI00194309C2|nr:hypothetical protein [Planotetraspora kaengkrachanensis]